MKSESDVSKEDKENLTTRLISLNEKYKNHVDSDNLDDLVKDYQNLLKDILYAHNKNKGGFAMMWMLETFHDIMTATARSARNECSYVFPETRFDKILFVNKKLIEKMIQLCKDNDYKC